MIRFDYVRAKDIAGAVQRRKRRANTLSRRRHQSRRSAEGERRAPGPRHRYQSPAAARDHRLCRRRAAPRRAGQQRRHRTTTRASARAIRCWRPRSLRAPARNCATPPPTAAISTSARAAITSTTCRHPATNAIPAAAAARSSGVNRIHAILGASEQCIATHPSDMCVALAALEATVRVTGPDGERDDRVRRLSSPARRRAAARQHAAARRTGHRDRSAGREFRQNFTYLKIRDRLSYAFALVSVAVALRIEGGTIAEAHVALGGVAHKPWRLPQAEARLKGAPSDTTFAAFADALLAGAKGEGHNDFKIDLASAPSCARLRQAAAGTPQSQSDKRIA